jgi:hypothetical protein
MFQTFLLVAVETNVLGVPVAASAPCATRSSHPVDATATLEDVARDRDIFVFKDARMQCDAPPPSLGPRW